MPEQVKLPKKLSQESGALPLSPSHQRIVEDLELWANSSGLQPPRSDRVKKGNSDARSRA